MQEVFSNLNTGQISAVQLTQGPLLVIAGPGSGKTLTLVRRTMNILLSGLATPVQIVLCTFTEKAALELRDRVRKAAVDLKYEGEISSLRVGTLHGLSHEFVELNRHHTRLASNFETLDDLTQKLFLFDKFDEIVPEQRDGKYFGTWSSKWSTIDFVLPYFDKITEELIEPSDLCRDPEAFVRELGQAYIKYEEAMWANNKVDFAHLQRIFLDVLQGEEVGAKLKSSIKYVMVDEYQDTNTIQELLVRELSSVSGNLCVVGDEDQALYRFRGATVRNILEFKSTTPNCEVVKLEVNYRSHRQIVDSFSRYMEGHDWSSPDTTAFRYSKSIRPNEPQLHPEYPSVLSIWGKDPEDEAERFADLVLFLKENGVIEDYSQVALLLYSVKEEKSLPYMEALESRGIKSFCPRARAFFSNDEVRLLVGSLAVILDWHGENRGSDLRGSLLELANYVDECILFLGELPAENPLFAKIQSLRNELETIKPGKALDRRMSDYLYQLISAPPFDSFVMNTNRARNLALFSQLTSTFQRYYNYTVISEKNLPYLRGHFFASFLRFLHSGGINEYEDPDAPFPKDHVQIMTIHQSKGLEFPVVFVGSLTQNINVQKKIDTTLSPYYSKPPFEPQDRVTGFDRMRLHYVAFSRAEKLLVLTNGSSERPKDHFAPIWDGLPQWPAVKKDLIAAQSWKPNQKLPPKKSYSFTGDLKVYETCPRQYQMYRYLEFAPSRAVMVFFGLLVHQTIEDIHRRQLDGQGQSITQEWIEGRFEFNYRHLLLRETRQIGQEQKNAALNHVLNYWKNNLDQIARVVETEIDVSFEKDGYILNGAIDLILADDGSLEVLDFKAQNRPPADSPIIPTYYKQLCIYAHLLQQRQRRTPDRLIIYWTGEEDRSNAVMEFKYDPSDVGEAVSHFDRVVRDIQAQNFLVSAPPDKKVCTECDFRQLCQSDGTINLKGSRRS